MISDCHCHTLSCTLLDVSLIKQRWSQVNNDSGHSLRCPHILPFHEKSYKISKYLETHSAEEIYMSIQNIETEEEMAHVNKSKRTE